MIQSSRFLPTHRVLNPAVLSLSRHEIFHPGWVINGRNKLVKPFRLTKKLPIVPGLIFFERTVQNLWRKLFSRTTRVLFAAGFHIIQEITFLKKPMNLLKYLQYT
jgi:hypothetical protein